MTAIGAFGLQGRPILIGDLVVSANEERGEDVWVPTIGSTWPVFPPGSAYVVRGLKQKVVVCHDRLAVAWTGPVIAAASVLRDLCSITAPTRRAIERCFGDQAPSALTDDLEVLGFVIEDDGYCGFLSRGRSVEFSETGAFFGGTGGGHLAEAAGWLASGGGGAMGIPPGTMSPADQAAFLGTGVVGNLIAREVVGGETLLQYFGGGYELVTIADGRFHRLDRVAYLLQTAEIGETTIGLSPFRLIRPTYIDETLCVLTAKCNGNSVEETVTYLIEPPHAPVPSAAIERVRDRKGRPSFAADWVCTVTFFRVDGLLTCQVRVDGGGPNAYVQVDSDEAGISYVFHETFFTQLREAVVASRALPSP